MKKILTILLAAFLLVSLLPVSKAEAHVVHDLSVVFSNGTTPVSPTDYSWTGSTLYIHKDGLVVSGTTTAENISIDDGVTNLTINNLALGYETGFYDNAITFCNTSAPFELIVKGNNTISATEMDACGIYGTADFTISGDGNLTINLFGFSIFNTSGDTTFKCTGTIAVDSSYKTMIFGGPVTIDPLTNKILCYSNDSAGAFSGFTSLTLGQGISMKGNQNYQAEENLITGTVDYMAGSGTVKTNRQVCKSVLITSAPPTGDHTNAALLSTVLVLSALALFGLFFIGKKKFER